MPELRWSCCLCAQAFHLIDMVLQPQQAGPMMPLLAQPPLAMALLYSSFNIWTTLMSYVAGTNQSAIPLGGMARYSVGMDSGNHGATRTESRTLYVEGLPSNCTKREVAHIFRPFSGFREVRMVNKESRHAISLMNMTMSLPTCAYNSLSLLAGGQLVGLGNSLFHEAMSPHYVHRLNNQMSYAAGANQSAIPLGGMATYSVGMDSGNHGATRTE
uniref:RRM domain-containing protein n=1 Tax=Oryza nivara TaxID=4536 RepID=A0A0E0IMN0_ORYNI